MYKKCSLVLDKSGYNTEQNENNFNISIKGYSSGS